MCVRLARKITNEAMPVARTLAEAASVWLCGVLLSSCSSAGSLRSARQTESRAGVAREDITDFATLCIARTARCHGADGKNGPGRTLNNPLYLAVIPRETLQQMIENGRPGTAMPAWARSKAARLTEKQIDALVNGIEQNWAKPARFHGSCASVLCCR